MAKPPTDADPFGLGKPNEVEPVSLKPPSGVNRKSREAQAYFDKLVAGASREKGTKWPCPAKSARGLSVRLGKAIRRAKLEDVFDHGSGKEADGSAYIYMRPIEQESES